MDIARGNGGADMSEVIDEVLSDDFDAFAKTLDNEFWHEQTCSDQSDFIWLKENILKFVKQQLEEL